jgi:hypothetical protein
MARVLHYPADEASLNCLLAAMNCCSSLPRWFAAAFVTRLSPVIVVGDPPPQV